jgi:uncharacterized membrane protein YfcA
MSKNEKKYPKGYWMGIGISIGVAVGAALGPIFENIGIGIAIGVAIGSGIGASLEQRNKANVRLPTEQENKRLRWGVVLGLLVMLTSIIAIVLLLFSRTK